MPPTLYGLQEGREPLVPQCCPKVPPHQGNDAFPYEGGKEARYTNICLTVFVKVNPIIIIKHVYYGDKHDI